MLTLPRMRHSALQQQPCGGASHKTVSGDRFLLFFLLWASTLGVSLIYWPPEVSTNIQFSSVQSLSRVQLCDPMNCSTPGLPVHHQLPEFTQTHVHRVGDAIQPSHPLLSLSSPAPNPSHQHYTLLKYSQPHESFGCFPDPLLNSATS